MKIIWNWIKDCVRSNVSSVCEFIISRSERVRTRMFASIVHIAKSFFMAILFKTTSHVFFFDKDINNEGIIKSLKQSIDREIEWVKMVPVMLSEIKIVNEGSAK